jgi:hypothetical protein
MPVWAKQGADQWVVHRFNGVELDHLAKTSEEGGGMRASDHAGQIEDAKTVEPTGVADWLHLTDWMLPRISVATSRSLGQSAKPRSCAAVGAPSARWRTLFQPGKRVWLLHQAAPGVVNLDDQAGRVGAQREGPIVVRCGARKRTKTPTNFLM